MNSQQRLEIIAVKGDACVPPNVKFDFTQDVRLRVLYGKFVGDKFAGETVSLVLFGASQKTNFRRTSERYRFTNVSVANPVTKIQNHFQKVL